MNIRKLASISVFPGTMLLALSLSYWALLAGINPGLIPIMVVPIIFALMVVYERFLPYKEAWNQNHGDVLPDALHLAIAQVLIPRLMKPVFVLLVVQAVAASGSSFVAGGWPHSWPLLAQLFLMLLIAEFGRYWVHRAAHRVPFLWKLHAVHHSPKRLYWLNAARFHPIEKVIFLIPEVVPFIVLGTGIETLTLYFIFNGVHGIFQHSNIELKLGPLNYIFSMTELHRWHHSKVIQESDTNFGNNLIFWDIVFGTFFWPKEREVAVIGLYNPDYPESYIGHMKAPFMGNVDKPADYKERKDYYDQAVLAEVRAAEGYANPS